MRRALWTACAAVTVLATLSTLPRTVEAQETGSVALALQLRQLDGDKRVLMIGAHPDDEDTSLLAELSRGHGAETAYLSLTRGEGGQNLIGPELFEGLGIIRTGELLAARRVDGGSQFFTRAFDFGYSKRAEEALSLWPEDELLGDVVWAVRKFRPHLIISVFSGTPADGHGQHQAAGIMAQRVFEAAADPEQYPEHMQQGALPWQVSKLYRIAWRNPDAATSAVQTGTYDPLLGRSHFQVAMESRSQHRSQEMGASQGLGPRVSSLELVRASAISGAEADLEVLKALDAGGIFAAVDTSFVWLLPEGSPGATHLEQYRAAIAEAREAFDPFDPSGTLEALAPAYGHLAAARASIEDNPYQAHANLTLSARERSVSKTALLASGLVWDVRASDDLIVPGQVFRIDVELWNGGSSALGRTDLSLAMPAGTEVSETDPPAPAGRFAFRGASRGPEGPEADAVWTDELAFEVTAIAPGDFVRRSFFVRTAPTVTPTELYYLKAERNGARYQWLGSSELWSLPRDPDPFQAHLEVEAHGVSFLATKAIRYRGVDPAEGEFSEPVQIVPAVSVTAEPGVLVWPEGSTEPRNVSVTVRSAAQTPRAGTLRLELPEGFRTEPESVDFDLSGAGAEQTIVFELLSSGTPERGEQSIRAVAEVAGRLYDQSVEIVDYEHIPRTPVYRSDETRVSVFPVQIAAGLKLGYVMGSGDAVPDAVRQLGIEPTMLGEAELASADLSDFDVIVLGIRAYATRPDLRRYNDRVLQFAEDGGTLIVQYHQYDFPRGGYAPYPVEISRPHDRVSVEEAPVTLLDAGHPASSVPNQIEDADFDGWVQERGLYFLSEWDDAYTPLLEMNDPGEEAKRGSLLVAPVGKGTYVYTGLAFFRQLPAGVPGAYRLFANLLSLKSPGVS